MKNIHRRNIRFKNLVAGLPKDKVIGISIDPSKYFHRVLIFDFTGKLLTKPFSIDTLINGYTKLIRKVTLLQRNRDAKKVYFAIEHAGGFSENLMNHLIDDGYTAYYVAATAVAKNRSQKQLKGLKNDDIDAGAVGDILVRGEFLESHRESCIYKNLKNLVYWRERKISLRSIVKNQLTFRLDKIFPGHNSDFDNNQPLYGNAYENFLHIGLMKSGLSGHELLEKSNEELREIFGYVACAPWKVQLKKLKTKLNSLMLPNKENSQVDLELLRKDFELLTYLNQEIEVVEKRIIEMAKMTDAKYIMGQVAGISDLSVAIYIALVGNMKKYQHAGKIFSKSGLAPSVFQSANKEFKRRRCSKAGNRLLRSILFRMASSVIINNNSFRDYYTRIKKVRENHWKVRRIAVSRKINKLFFALVRDQKPYEYKAAESSSRNQNS